MLPCFVVVTIVEIYHERVHVVVGVVYAEVDSALYIRVALELLVEVDTEVEAMVGLETIVIAVFKVTQGASIAICRVGLLFVVVGVECATIARGVYPCGAEVYAVTELIVGGNVDIVAAVILGMEGASFVDDMSLAVKLAHGL